EAGMPPRSARLGRDSGLFSCPASAISALPGTLHPSRQQLSPDEVEVCECERGIGTHGVFPESAVADLPEAPQLLHHVEGMLAASSNPGPRAVDPPPESRQWFVTVTPLVDPVADPGTVERLAISVLPVGRITVELSLLTVEQVPKLLAVVL